MNITKCVAVLSFVLTLYLTPQITVAQDSLFIIPKPKIQIGGTGHYLYTSKTEVFASADFKNAVELLREHPYLKFNQVKTLKNVKHIPKQGIVLAKATKEDTLTQNAYRLEITKDRILITAHQSEALLHGISTLRQIAYTRKDTKSLPAVWIEDQPAFGYRGLMLDVSRHFLPLTFLKKYIDLLSLYKINTFHWHLTDGAGWRLEIKKYPELTQFAAWRSDASWKDWWNNDRKYVEMGSPAAFGGFYTADQAKELILYAAKRGVTVIPEIEMPAHSEEVLATYPNLSCYGLPYKNSEFCIGNQDTFTFLQNVLDEVLEIFPSKYIHIGGDEADKTAWKQCPKCQKVIKDHNLKDEHGLQSYAIKRIEAFLTSKGRKLIGWDEILEGGLAPDATVMSWRGEKGGIEAANSGHDVIMTPGSHLYLDSYQTNPIGQPEAIGGYLPLEKVYSYQPIPADVAPAKRKHIIGVQANVWLEYMSTANQVDYMVFPRAIALSEVGWTPQSRKNWHDFHSRLQKHYQLLQQFNVNYYPPSNKLSILSSFDMANKIAQVKISSEQFKPEIRYTLDGATPTVKSPLYQDGTFLMQTGTVKAQIFKNQLPMGKVQELEIDLHKAIGKKVTYNKRYSSQYPAQKELTLVNGQTGDLTYGDGQWQGFLGDLDITIDLENQQALRQLKMTYMQLIGPGVYMPANVKVALSTDGINFKTVQQIDNDVPYTDASLRFKTFIFDLKGNAARYVRITAKNEKKGFMFSDEVVVY